MITLAMDTAYKFLNVGLYEDGKLLAGSSEECFKKQSEMIFVVIENLLKQTGLKFSDIDECVITDGPGSYTGLRIAMTIAKMLGALSPAKVYTLSTMQLYAGKEKAANVILDARGHRAYIAHLENGRVTEDGILDLDLLPDFLKEHRGTLFGDGFLVGQEAEPTDFLQNFADLRDQYQEVENIHALIPRYYKESDAYRV